MLRIRNMRVEDAEAVATMDALDHNSNPEKGYKEAREHTLDHPKIVAQHCYVVEDDAGQTLQQWFCTRGRKFSK